MRRLPTRNDDHQIVPPARKAEPLQDGKSTQGHSEGEEMTVKVTTTVSTFTACQ